MFVTHVSIQINSCSGIGRGTVQRLASAGCNVIAVSKTEEYLKTLKAEVSFTQTQHPFDYLTN